jgi:formylmethanofuran dehydrogenase subunit E
MRYLLILLFLLSGCANTQFYPTGIKGRQVEYFNNFRGKVVCSKCHKQCSLFKTSKDGKTIICSDCYDKYY